MNEHKAVIDGAVAAGAITLPWWAVFLNEWAGLALTLVGLTIAIFRLILIFREWQGAK
jgi:hypothetical protein